MSSAVTDGDIAIPQPSQGVSQSKGRQERRKEWWAKTKEIRSKLRDRSTLAKKENFQLQPQVVLQKVDTSRGFQSTTLTIPAPELIRKSPVSGSKAGGQQVKPRPRTKVQSKQDTVAKHNKKKSKTTVKQEPKTEKVDEQKTEISEISINAKGVDKSGTNCHIPKSYVLFIGNLPYDVTQEQLMEHFRKTGGVKTIRIPKEKGTNKGRGFAYIEFKDRISHGIALRLHHTTLGDRRINVEFTSIGGNTAKRRKKLEQKNKALANLRGGLLV